jgi:hypothetical protein
MLLVCLDLRVLQGCKVQQDLLVFKVIKEQAAVQVQLAQLVFKVIKAVQVQQAHRVMLVQTEEPEQ